MLTKKPLVKQISFEIDGNFSDPVSVWQKFLEALNVVKGITILATLKHDFPGGGVSGIVIIGESHAAIHTWPEKNRAWVELVTCGDPASLTSFRYRITDLFKL
jgi:S-adenosylmethionine decarboxylase